MKHDKQAIPQGMAFSSPAFSPVRHFLPGVTCNSGHDNLFQLPVHICTERGGHPVSVDGIVFRNLAIRIPVEERIASSDRALETGGCTGGIVKSR